MKIVQPKAPLDWTTGTRSYGDKSTTIQRRQCVVFVHDKTRFVIVLLGVTQKELKQLDYWFEEMLGNCMLKLDYDHELIQKACDGIGELTFDTRCSRSVQGSLRLMIGNLEAYTWDSTDIMEPAPYTLSAQLSDRPCRVKGMGDGVPYGRERRCWRCFNGCPKDRATTKQHLIHIVY